MLLIPITKISLKAVTNENIPFLDSDVTAFLSTCRNRLIASMICSNNDFSSCEFGSTVICGDTCGLIEEVSVPEAVDILWLAAHAPRSEDGGSGDGNGGGTDTEESLDAIGFNAPLIP